MMKLRHVSSTSFFIRTSKALLNKMNARCIHKPYFAGKDVIMENVIGNFVTIGINLPETKNALTETVLDKLGDSIKKFERHNEIRVAILHGCGGNFCRGVDGTVAYPEPSRNLLEVLHTMKKPIIAALDGHTTDFGLHLAVMCDIRIMDQSAVARVCHVPQTFEIPPFLYERLILTVGLSRAFELLCTRQTWFATECLTMGLVSKITDFGCALGQSMIIAQNIGFNSPVESVIGHKSKMLSFLKRIVQ